MKPETKRKIAETCRRIMYDEWDKARKHPCFKCGRVQLGWRWRQNLVDGEVRDYCVEHWEELKRIIGEK